MRCGISPSRGRNICGARNRSSKPHFTPDTCAEDMAEPPGPNFRSHRSKRRKRRIRARDRHDRLQFAISRSARNFSGQFAIRNFRNPQEVGRILVWIHSSRYCADMGARAVPVCQNGSSEAGRVVTSALQWQGSENLRNVMDCCGSKPVEKSASSDARIGQLHESGELGGVGESAIWKPFFPSPERPARLRKRGTGIQNLPDGHRGSANVST